MLFRCGVEAEAGDGCETMRVLLAMISFVIGAIVVEVGARAWLGPPVSFDQRVALFSSPSWRYWPGEGAGELRYAPNVRIRAISWDGDRIEYDVVFRTNGQGFIDERDYPTARGADVGTRIGFVGDSFTAGFHGGDPWVPRLARWAREGAADLEIYNLGIGATGFAQFHELARSLAEPLALDRVVVMFIGDDLHRGRFWPREERGRIHVCLSENWAPDCDARPTHMLVLAEADSAPAEVAAQVQASGLIRPPRSLSGRLAQKSHVVSLLTRGASAEATPPTRSRQWNDGWIASFLEDFVPEQLVFVQIPQRHEVARGALDHDVGTVLREAGLAYVSLLERCNFVRQHFYGADRHPNAAGYDMIARCVARTLGLPAPATEDAPGPPQKNRLSMRR